MGNRHDDAFEIRKKAAKIAQDRDFAKNHPDNGEEDKYKDLDGNRNFIANYTKGLKHHIITDRDAGEVINPDYRKLLDAIKSEKPQDFENLPLGLGRKFTNPQAGFAFDLEGPDSHDLAIRPAPKIDSAEAAGEMAELYWMALCRDVPFSEFDINTLIYDAVADLSTNYSDFPHDPFPGPVSSITSSTIFRGIGNGVLTGQYISQFLYKDIKWGAQILQQKQRIVTIQDYLTDYQSWLDAQDGKVIAPDDKFNGTASDLRYIITPRDLAYCVHVDALYQAYLGACLILLGDDNKFDPLLPYQNSNTQIGFGTFGGPHILSLVTEVATRALKAVWFQKWIVHRRLRPEAFGGLIHRQKNSSSPSPTPGLTTPNPPYQINQEILNSGVLPKIFQYNATSNPPGSYLLPQAFPEGSPTHPSYGAGHATVAGACVTILKAWFDEDDFIKNPKKPTDDGSMLVDAGGPQLTVGGELNKLAANIAIGRNWAGVHYRSDYTESILLGEKIAIGILQEQALTYSEKFACTLTKFDGKKIKFEGTKFTQVNLPVEAVSTGSGKNIYFPQSTFEEAIAYGKTMSTSRPEKTKKTIVAYSMFDSDLNFIRNMMSKNGLKKELDGDGYIFGEIYEEDIERVVEEKRVVLKVLDHKLPIETPGRRVPQQTRYVLSDTIRRLGIVSEFLHSDKKTKFYIVQLKGPLFQEWLKKLETLDIPLLQYFPVYSYLTELTDNQSSQVEQLPFVNSVTLFKEEDKGIFVSRETREYIRDFDPHSTSPNDKNFHFDVIVHVASDLETVRRWLLEHRAKIDHYRGRKICISLNNNVEVLLKMTKLPEIQIIEEYVPPQLFSETHESYSSSDNSELIGHSTSNEYMGREQIVGIADNAIDNSHPDFDKQVIGIEKRGGNNGNIDKVNHGTHISGIVLGNGTASKGRFCGIAPKAKLYFQSLSKSDMDLYGGLSRDIEDLFKKAYDNYVRIHNDSWGSKSVSGYSLMSSDADWFVYNNQDMLIITAAGNSMDLKSFELFKIGSISEPGTAKNVVTVGAVKSTDLGCLWPNSNRGPCKDDNKRIKPDIVAPGTDIIGPISKDAVEHSNSMFRILKDDNK